MCFLLRCLPEFTQQATHTQVNLMPDTPRVTRDSAHCTGATTHILVCLNPAAASAMVQAAPEGVFPLEENQTITFFQLFVASFQRIISNSSQPSQYTFFTFQLFFNI